MIAKLVNGYPVPCPKQGADGAGNYHTDLPRYYAEHPETAALYGYYPVKYTEKPTGDYLPVYEIINGEIVQEWEPYTPTPEPPDVDVLKLRSDVDYIAMMTDVDLDGDAV